MGLRDDLAELNDAHHAPGSRCRVGFLYDTLPDDECEQFRDLVERNVVPATLICQAMRRHGYDVSSASVNRHRKRKVGNGCSCP